MKETSISSKQEIKDFFNDKRLNNIFVLSGKNSYIKSGAKKFLDPILKNKKAFVYLKKSYYPEFNDFFHKIYLLHDHTKLNNFH